jgi:hypothetical protein
MLAVSANKFGVVIGGAATPQVLHLVRQQPWVLPFTQKHALVDLVPPLPSKSGKILAKFDPNSSQTLLRK